MTKEEIKFTANELVEIEKAFDERAERSVTFVAMTAERVSHFKKKPEIDEFMDKICRESVHTWDTFRTISAKAQRMREAKQHEM